MKLTVLLDNNTLIDRYLLGEPGVSYLIEDGGTKVLLDVGYSDAFITNARKMGVNLLDVDVVVLSHSHNDHTWGLFPLIQLYNEAVLEKLPHKKPTLVAHPALFASRKFNGQEIGSILTKSTLASFFNLQLSQAPIALTERLHFLGEIERSTPFECIKAVGTVIEDGIAKDDYVLEDTALAYQADDGLVIITGCSHSGICNIIEQAKKLFGDRPIRDIFGGLHLIKPPAEQLAGTLSYLEALEPAAVHACHCTDLRSKIALAGVVNLLEVGVGLVMEYS
ncbi:MAG: MBL fold metallo-hydrolase [Anaerolineales bacterium]|nr:MBL fold metallo-hydrolase [Anaerolineales bacterium]